jgi:hypothetical protein
MWIRIFPWNNKKGCASLLGQIEPPLVSELKFEENSMLSSTSSASSTPTPASASSTSTLASESTPRLAAESAPALVSAEATPATASASASEIKPDSEVAFTSSASALASSVSSTSTSDSAPTGPNSDPITALASSASAPASAASVSVPAPTPASESSAPAPVQLLQQQSNYVLDQQQQQGAATASVAPMMLGDEPALHVRVPLSFSCRSLEECLKKSFRGFGQVYRVSKMFPPHRPNDYMVTLKWTKHEACEAVLNNQAEWQGGNRKNVLRTPLLNEKGRRCGRYEVTFWAYSEKVEVSQSSILPEEKLSHTTMDASTATYVQSQAEHSTEENLSNSVVAAILTNSVQLAKDIEEISSAGLSEQAMKSCMNGVTALFNEGVASLGQYDVSDFFEERVLKPFEQGNITYFVLNFLATACAGNLYSNSCLNKLAAIERKVEQQTRAREYAKSLLPEADEASLPTPAPMQQPARPFATGEVGLFAAPHSHRRVHVPSIHDARQSKSNQGGPTFG